MKDSLSHHPRHTFPETWPGWNEFLGTGKPRPKRPEEWVPIAEQLAKDYGGRLPNPGWLMKNGYAAMYRSITKYPGVFSGIKIDSKKGVPHKSWVPLAESLAEKNGGALPPYITLMRSGHSDLARAIIKSPELFLHLRREKVHRSPEDWLAIASQVASQHGGKIPHRKWMKDNGYDGLCQAMAIHPELFSMFDRTTKRVPISEWVRVAKRLASENNGKLPSRKFLAEHGYNGLDQAFRKHRAAFGELTQEKLNHSKNL